MTRRPPSDLAASVHGRLKRRFHEAGGNYEALLLEYVTERFLYRLSVSSSADRFILKGAMLFVAWETAPHRHTRDIDFLSLVEEGADDLMLTFSDICLCHVEPDGLDFDAGSITVTPIRSAFDFAGFRADIQSRLGKSRLPLQIDVGFGDAVTPEAVRLVYPTLLDFPAPVIRAYRRETVVAEKLQAMVQHGLDNSRMKDLCDVRALSQRFAFSGEPLKAAISATFGSRGAAVPPTLPITVGEEFALDPVKLTQWGAFVRKSHVDPVELSEVVAALRRFLTEPDLAAAHGEPFVKQWPAGGPWS